MKKLTFLLLLLYSGSLVFSNSIVKLEAPTTLPFETEDMRCPTMDGVAYRLANDPEYTQYYNAARAISTNQKVIDCNDPNFPPIVVPVAFHFAPGVVTCEDAGCVLAEVQDQLDAMNAAFGDNTGTAAEAACPAAYQDAAGNSVASTGTCISFCLAIPPTGNAQGLDPACDPPITIGEFAGGVVFGGNGAPGWDGILNIFIVNDPNSGLSGASDGIPGAGNGDGVSVIAAAFGGTAGLSGCILDTDPELNLGALMAHEIGHYLGLLHTHWDGNIACSDNDVNPPGPYNVNDTPIQDDPSLGCPTACVVGCTAIPEPTANFMAYTDDACMSMFTEDQAAVMNYWANQLFSASANQCSAAPLTVLPNTCLHSCADCDFTTTISSTCNDDGTYTAVITVSGGIGPFNITESSGTAPQSYTGVTAGTYFFTITEDNSVTITTTDTGAGDCMEEAFPFDPCISCDLEVVPDYSAVTCEDFGGTLFPSIPFTVTNGVGTVWIDQDGNTTFDAFDIDITGGATVSFPASDLTLTVYDSGDTDCALAITEITVLFGNYSCDGLNAGDPPLLLCNFDATADVAGYVCNGDGTATVTINVTNPAGNITFDNSSVTTVTAGAEYTVSVPIGAGCGVTTIVAADDGADISQSQILEITAPAAIAGDVFAVGTNDPTQWGIDINTVSPCVSGILVPPTDGTAPENDFCEPTPPTTPTAAQCANIAGNIAIIDRGSCSFTTKVENAQACGAIAAVICNNDATNPDAVFDMSGASVGAVTIPTVFLSYNQCQAIYMELLNGDVSVCIGAPVDVPCEQTIEIDACAFTDPCCATVDLDIQFDGFPNQTSWDITDASGNVVASSGGTYSGQSGNSQLSLTPACLPDGCYDLNFYDSINNGMCPFRAVASSSGIFITPGTLIPSGSVVATLGTVVAPGLCGNYQLYDTNGTLLASGGGSFGGSETNNFCISGGAAQFNQSDDIYARQSTLDNSSLDMWIAPTLADDIITVFSNLGEVDNVQINVVNIRGQVMQQYLQDSYDTTNIQLNVSDLSSGIYFVQMVVNDIVLVEKFVKR